MTVTQGLLWPYVKSEGVYRCPAQQQVFAGDYRSGPSIGSQIGPGVVNATPPRSFTICAALNSVDAPDSQPTLRLADVLHPTPSSAFVFADENLLYDRGRRI